MVLRMGPAVTCWPGRVWQTQRDQWMAGVLSPCIRALPLHQAPGTRRTRTGVSPGSPGDVPARGRHRRRRRRRRPRSCHQQGWQGRGVARVAKWPQRGRRLLKKRRGRSLSPKLIIHTTILDSNQHHHGDDWIPSLHHRKYCLYASLKST